MERLRSIKETYQNFRQERKRKREEKLEAERVLRVTNHPHTPECTRSQDIVKLTETERVENTPHHPKFDYQRTYETVCTECEERQPHCEGGNYAYISASSGTW